MRTTLATALAVALPITALADDATLTLITDGLDFPANVAVPRDGSGRLFVAEHYTGHVRVIEDGKLVLEPWLDIGGRLTDPPALEEGLVGLAFPPDFPATPYVYVAYTAEDLIISRFPIADGRPLVDSEEILLSAPRFAPHHHCGHLAFGPEGALYACVGDSDEQGHPRGTAQDPAAIHGKLLRLDPAAPPAQPEVLAYGLRNPWRFTIDPVTGNLVIPDAGWDAWEEINLLGPGETGVNFGWPLAEGNDCVEACDDRDLRWPVFEYPNDDRRCAVIGGAVYRGDRFPAWHGVYVFGDMCSGELWAIRGLGEPEAAIRTLIDADLMMTAIGRDGDGEIVVADSAGGAIYRLAFPADAEAGWQDLEEVMLAQAMAARREAATAHIARMEHAERTLQRIQNSRRWRYTQWMPDLYQWLTDLIGLNGASN